ncbi:hypothetical protein [Anaeromusa sp.]|uniref:hypothetical protein n=1 Tax=Anaeromusa sp. TaxID=1872520 RepID=UPI00262C8A24|nr:hypothetical protein [Anaeromusa sp.]MDD3157469.1 hypothetical protein [Anaeromusa sp.]
MTSLNEKPPQRCSTEGAKENLTYLQSYRMRPVMASRRFNLWLLRDRAKRADRIDSMFGKVILVAFVYFTLQIWRVLL